MGDFPHGARFWPQSALKLKDLKYEGDEEERCAKLRAEIEALNDIDDEGAGLTDEQDQQRDQLQHDLDAIESEVRGRSFEAKKKKQTGCIVDVEDGRLVVLYGIKKPAEAKASSAGGHRTTMSRPRRQSPPNPRRRRKPMKRISHRPCCTGCLVN
jgi:ParB family chromosome partitioning protein